MTYGRVCPDLQHSLQEIVRRIVELESQGLLMQAEEERADDDAYRVEKQLRKLQVAKQGNDRDLTEAKLWLSSIARGEVILDFTTPLAVPRGHAG